MIVASPKVCPGLKSVQPFCVENISNIIEDFFYEIRPYGSYCTCVSKLSLRRNVRDGAGDLSFLWRLCEEWMGFTDEFLAVLWA